MRSYLYLSFFYLALIFTTAYTVGYSRPSWGEDTREKVLNINMLHGAKLTKDISEIGKAIRVAALDSGWRVNQSLEGGMYLSRYYLNARVTVALNYDRERITIYHYTSNKMLFDGQKIDPVYNEWVKDLAASIKKTTEELDDIKQG